MLCLSSIKIMSTKNMLRNMIKTKPFGDTGRVALTCNKDNVTAMGMYRDMGFKDTGVVDDDEVELSMTI